MRPATRSASGRLLPAVTALLVFSFFAPLGPAQKAGDVAVLGATIGPVSASGAVYDRTGKFVVGIPVSSPFGGLTAGTAAPFNDGILFGAPQSRLPVSYDLMKFNGVVSSLARIVPGVPRCTSVAQNGDALLLIQGSLPAGSGIYRVTRGAITTIATGFTTATPGAFGEDVDTGNFVVADANGTVFILSRAGTVLATRANVFSGSVGAMETEYATGALLVAQNALHRYDVQSNVVTTVAPSSGYGAIDWDPAFGGFWAASGKGLEWLDRNLNRTAISQWGLFSAFSVVSWGSRNLTGQARPAVGSAYPIVLSMPGEGLKAFQAAASFGIRPGISTGAGTVHLNPDPLFSLSVSAPSIFAGFSGTLTANGTAQLTVNIPNAGALRGLRFFVAAVSHDAGGIRRVSEPLGVNVQ